MVITVALSKRVQRTIAEVSRFYMSAMNSQLQQKFSLTIELTREKIDGIINRTPPEGELSRQELLNALSTSAEVRSFTYLGFLGADGRLETVYGADTQITDNEDIIKALELRGNIAETGVNSLGERCLLLGRSAAYPMADGTKSLALVAGVSVEYLSSVIFAENDNSVIFSHVIDESGNYVIRTSLPGSVSGNYMDYVRTELDGLSREDAENYAASLEKAIRERKEYTSSFTVNGEVRWVYCMPLYENSTWYLVTVMPNGFLDESITRLDRDRMGLMALSSFIILAVLSLTFFQYYRLSQQQMRLLDAAKEESVRANNSKSAFLSNMSHDLRTPMNAIVGMSEIALKNLDDQSRVEDCLKKVQLSSKQLLGLINDILDMSKIESGKMTLHPEELSLREAMRTIVDIIQPQVKAKNQSFDIFIRDILSEHVWCDSVRLNQILLNLLSNALKFTPEGGKIRIYLSQEPSAQGEGYVRTLLRVDDTGIGMSPEFQKRLFGTFEREATDKVHHTMGSGLGMSITKHIVDMMGGSIEVHSQQGRGSSFRVTVDFKRAKSEAEMRLPPWNILIIDDNQPLCESAASNLEALGVHAEWTTECEQALQMVKGRHDRGEDYQFVLVDWRMPYLSGPDAIREIRKCGGDGIPVFLISAYDWNDIQEEAQELRIEGFIPKPLFKSTLYESLSRYTQEEEPPQAGPEEEAAADLTGKRILLAEDNDLNWEIAFELLGETGAEIERAENGKICVEKLEGSEPGYYSVILMDIQMPVMDGYEATKRVRASTHPDRNIPIVAMTADAFSEDVQRCMECGMNYHLSKPLNFQECREVLRRFLS